MSTLSAHGLSAERVVSRHAHYPEPVRHHERLLLWRIQEHQRLSGRTAGGVMEPILVFRLFRFLVHPSAKLILGERRQLHQILRSTNILRLHAGSVETFPIEWNLIRLLHELVKALLLNLLQANVVVSLRIFSVQLHQVKEQKYVYHFFLQLIQHLISPPISTPGRG